MNDNVLTDKMQNSHYMDYRNIYVNSFMEFKEERISGSEMKQINEISSG